MCQMCEEADAYLAQIEAAAKRRAEAQKAETAPDKNAPKKPAVVAR